MKIGCLLMLILVMQVASKQADQPKVTKGPYRAVLASVWRCQNTTYPLEKDPPIQLHMWTISSGTKNVRLLSCNMTVLRDTKQVRIKIKSFTWEGGRWKLLYSMDDISCRGKLQELFSKALGISLLDPSKCLFKKGSCSFASVDVNAMQHLVVSEMEYGPTLWRSEINVGFSTYQCFDFRIVFEPI